MPNATLQKRIELLLEGTGITINGTNPWDIHVHDERLYARILSQGSLGFGEAYMDGWWDCEALDELLTRIFHHQVHKKLRPSFSLIRDAILAQIMNRQAGMRAYRIAQAHYDKGNDLYQAMLDRRMTYTCGYWKGNKEQRTGNEQEMTLEEAQEAKLDLVCRKIGLKKGQHVLDIGCGWGSFAKFAAEKYEARVTGITVSKEQIKLGTELCRGLPVELRLQDYREIRESFDHIISLGMFEHVGYKNYRTYFEVARRCLKDDGLFLLHTIGGNTSVRSTDPWVNKYIFPDSMLPSAAQITKAAEGLFVMEDWHNFSADYEKTLMAWHKNFKSHWDELKSHYDDPSTHSIPQGRPEDPRRATELRVGLSQSKAERFHRMWRFYLLASAATFRARQNQLWQIVYSPHGVPGGYASIR